MRRVRIACAIGTAEEFERSMLDLMLLQPPLALGSLAIKVAEIRAATVAIKPRQAFEDHPARVVATGRLSADHCEVLKRIVAWHQPRISLGREGDLLSYRPRPARSGHDTLEAAERLIAFMSRTGSSTNRAERQVIGKARP